MKKAFIAFWNYFKEMNSEPSMAGGGVSIKRNISWAVGMLLLFVEIFSLIVLPRKLETEIVHFVYLCCFYAVLDAAFISLALSITSIEKITELVQKIKGGVFGGGQVIQEIKSSEEVKKENITTTTQTPEP